MTEQRNYPIPAQAAHTVPAMVCLEYKETKRARKWRVAYRMHVAGRDNMQSDGEARKRSGEWHDFRIVQENLT